MKQPFFVLRDKTQKVHDWNGIMRDENQIVPVENSLMRDWMPKVREETYGNGSLIFTGWTVFIFMISEKRRNCLMG